MTRSRHRCYFAAGLLAIAALCTSARSQPQPRKESIVEVNGLELVFSLRQQRIRNVGEFEARAVFRNASSHRIRLNALYTYVTQVMIDVRTAKGERVLPGPPPMPPVDDGIRGRIPLDPGQTVAFTYPGPQYFMEPLAPGQYETRFRYENILPNGGDWQGKIVTDWLPFEVIK